MRICRKTTAHPNGKAYLRFTAHDAANRAHTDIVDLGIFTPDRAATDRDLEFAGQVVVLGVPYKQASGFLSQRRRIANLISINSRKGAACHIAGYIPASSHGVQASPPKRLQH